MKEYSVVMSLVDLIPVVLFAVTAIILQRDLYYKMSKGAFALFSAGTIDIIAAGTLKALYKLLYALKICDFDKLNQMFFPVQSIGFLLAGIAIIAMLVHKQESHVTVMSTAPVLFSGTMIFVVCMIAGLGCINGGLSYIAVKMKKPAAVVLLIAAFILLLCMGYLSTKDFDKAYMNWMAEIINIAGQSCFFFATRILHKNNLAEFELNS